MDKTAKSKIIDSQVNLALGRCPRRKTARHDGDRIVAFRQRLAETLKEPNLSIRPATQPALYG
jgi:hypothetical protein